MKENKQLYFLPIFIDQISLSSVLWKTPQRYRPASTGLALAVSTSGQ